MPFYGISVVAHKYQYNVNIADEVEFNQEIAVVPVRSPLQKATAALAMLRLHCALLRSRRARGMSFFRSLGHPRLKQRAFDSFFTSRPRYLA